MLRINYILKLLAVGLLILILSACNNESKHFRNSREPTYTVTDFRGKTLEFHQPVKRMVCLIESALSGIYMLGGEEVLVGIPGDIYRDHIFFYYSQLDPRIEKKEIPTPGNWDFVSIEEVVSLQPELVIIWASQTEAIAALEQFHIPVYGVMIHSFEDVFKEISDLGMLLDRENRADSLMEFTRNKLAGSKIHNTGREPVSAYFMWAQGINETSGINSTVNEIFQFAGLRNVVDLEQEHVRVSIEKIIDWNPETIFMWYNEKLDPTDVLGNPLLQQVEAIKNKKVYELPDPFLCDFWTLKFLYTVKLVADWSYPEQTKNPVDSIDIFSILYGKPLKINGPEI
jgi:iron complex transport system substrate-binding protein